MATLYLPPDLDTECYPIASLRCQRNRSVWEAQGLMMSLLADLEGLSACNQGVAFCLPPGLANSRTALELASSSPGLCAGGKSMQESALVFRVAGKALAARPRVLSLLLVQRELCSV